MPNCLRVQRLSYAAVVIGIALGATAMQARAENFDGTYVGKATNERMVQGTEGSQLSCRPTYDVKVTVKGTSLQSENLSNGMRSTGQVQTDGSFTSQGMLGPGVTSSGIGQIQGNVLRARYMASATGGTICEGTISATRQ